MGSRIKRKTIWEDVDKMISWKKFLVEWRK